MLVSRRIFAGFLLVIAMGFSLSALAYPGPVAGIVRGGGQAGVARAPHTIDDATRTQLESVAHSAAGKTGGKVWLVIAQGSENTEDYNSLYSDVGFSGKDAIIVSNGPKWALHCNALSAAEKEGVLAKSLANHDKPLEKMQELTDALVNAVQHAKPVALVAQPTQNLNGRVSWNEFQHNNSGRHWSDTQMSRAYQQYKAGQPINVDNTGIVTTTGVLAHQDANQAPTSHKGLWIGLGVALLLVVGFVLWRRKSRDSGLAQELKQAVAGPENTMADVYMNLDESHPRFATLIEQATAVSSQLDGIKKAAPTRENIARLRSLDDQARQLRNAVGQR